MTRFGALYSLGNKKMILNALYVIAIIAYIWAIDRFFGWETVASAWADVPTYKIFLAMLYMFLTYLIRAYRLFDYFKIGDFTSCLQITMMHNFLNNIMPLRTGEASFPLLMRSRLGVSLLESSSVLVFFRLMDLHVLLLMGGLAFCMFKEMPAFSSALVFIVFLLPLLIFPLRSHIINSAWLSQYSMILRAIHALPSSLQGLSRAWLITLLCWVIKIFVYGFILLWFADTSLWQALLVAFSGELSSIVPIQAPGGVGTYEAGMVALSSILGVKGSWVLFAGVQLHLLIIVNTLLCGVIAYYLPRPARVNAVL